jgi:hypothetical protein
MDISWIDVKNVQEAGDYPFRDGTLTVTFAEMAIWKNDPEARFQLMRKHPIRTVPQYVLGRQIDAAPAVEQRFYESSNGDSWSLTRDTTGAQAVIHRPNEPSGGKPSQLEISDFLTEHANGPEHQALRRLLETGPRLTTILIAYDLHPREGPVSDAVTKAIQSLGIWWHHLETIWIVQCAMAPVEIRDLLKPLVGLEDQLLVVDISGDTAEWFGVNGIGSKWLAEHI